MRQRVFTAVIAGAVVLAAVFAVSPLPLVALALIASAIGIRELHALATSVGKPWSGPEIVSAIVVLLSAMGGLAWGYPAQLAPSLLVFLVMMGLLGAALLLGTVRRSPAAPPLLPALLWLLSPFGVAILVHLASSGGSGPFAPNLVLLLLLPLWVGDSVALFVGKAWGRHLLAPKVSPKKTWEGAIANLVGCLAAAVGLAVLLGVPWLAGVAVGLTTGVFGQLGDLLQSAMKRAADLKDSGTLLPGHGGLLDRIDSFLLSAGPSALMLLWLSPDSFQWSAPPGLLGR